MKAAQYVMLLSLAVPGLLQDLRHVRYYLSQAVGKAYIHAWLDYQRHELRWLREDYNADHGYEAEVRRRWGRGGEGETGRRGDGEKGSR